LHPAAAAGAWQPITLYTQHESYMRRRKNKIWKGVETITGIGYASRRYAAFVEKKPVCWSPVAETMYSSLDYESSDFNLF